MKSKTERLKELEEALENGSYSNYFEEERDPKKAAMPILDEFAALTEEEFAEELEKEFSKDVEPHIHSPEFLRKT